jgi:hypothetical protein
VKRIYAFMVLYAFFFCKDNAVPWGYQLFSPEIVRGRIPCPLEVITQDVGAIFPNKKININGTNSGLRLQGMGKTGNST